MLLVMKKLSEHHKFPARSAPELLERFDALVSKHQRLRHVTFAERKVSGEAVLSAIVMRFLDLPTEDQDRVLAAYVPRFEALLAEEGDTIVVPPLEEFGLKASTEQPRTPAYWRGGEVQHQTEELKRQIREMGRAKPKKAEPGSVGRVESVPNTPKRKRGAG